MCEIERKELIGKQPTQLRYRAGPYMVVRTLLGADVSPILFEACYNICGMRNTMMAMAEESEEMGRLMDRLETFCIQISTRSIELGVDMIWLGDDLGSQESLMI